MAMTESGGGTSPGGAEAPAHGLLIYRASRLEALLDPLRGLLAATAPERVLAPQTVIAAHPGMRQWLYAALARAQGAGGIVANLDILLPSAWIDTLAQRELGRQAVALPRYRREHLRWTLHAALGGDLAALGISDARLAGYLDAGADAAELARRKFQLADRLARIYSQYLVYRPDWLRAWERGQHDVATRGHDDPVAADTETLLLAPLWSHVRGRLGAHRADVVDALIARLRRRPAAARGGETLHAFGASHLAPSELAVLRAYARTRLVALYVPDPCREYWGGLARDLPAVRACAQAERERIAAAGEREPWAPDGHPLLARWGRLGQHFMMALADAGEDVVEDVRHWQDAAAAPATDRLGRVQQGIRELEPARATIDLADPAVLAAERMDASLRIHSCHTRLRELEVLRDALLDALAASGSALRPSDIVVMAPDIRAYVPLIPSVFGVAGDPRGPLPYHLADVPVARNHSLLGALRRLLEAPTTRMTAPQVVDLLSVPEIARRLQVEAGGVGELVGWLRESRVAWALDARFRTRFGAPPIAAHTFGWALDRLLAGYVMGDAADGVREAGVALADGSVLAPVPGVEGPSAVLLGALDQLLRELQAWCDLGDRTLRASAWSDLLARRIDALLRIDPADAAARDARELVMRLVRAIGAEPAAAGEDPELHFAVVRELLLDGLDAAPAHQRFLLGGVTFCGMVPERAIPFQVIAVLGLDEGAFPRSGGDAGLDLMLRRRRMGDRDVRSDDRYLFLETLMSARRRLHLSYVGQDVHDGGARNPATPLAELMAELDRGAGLAADDGRERPWCVRHPLQAFDARYFDGADPRLYSYSAAFASMHGRATAASVPPFLDPVPASSARRLDGEEAPAAVRLGDLVAWYRDPARQLLARDLRVSLDALDDARLPEDEPLSPGFPPLEDVARRLFFEEGIARGARELAEPPAWLRLTGLMPSGQPGAAAWTATRATVNALLGAAYALPGLAAQPARGARRPIDLELGVWHLTGHVEHVFAASVDGRAQLSLLRPFPGKGGRMKKEAELGFKERVPAFIDWAVLRLSASRAAGAAPPAVRLHLLVDGRDTPWRDGINAWDERFLAADPEAQTALLAQLDQRVDALLRWWRDARATPRWYFPKAAWASLAQARKADAADEAAAAGAAEPGGAWIADHDGAVGERDYAPGYNRLLAGAVAFAAPSPELDALYAFARSLDACITLDAPWPGDAA